jgi:hypothetical protein
VEIYIEGIHAQKCTLQLHSLQFVSYIFFFVLLRPFKLLNAHVSRFSWRCCLIKWWSTIAFLPVLELERNGISGDAETWKAFGLIQQHKTKPLWHFVAYCFRCSDFPLRGLISTPCNFSYPKVGSSTCLWNVWTNQRYALCENIKDDYYRRQRKLFHHKLVRSEKWAYAFLALI